MWSNVISIGKECEREIGFILDKLKDTKDISFAIEESKDRLWVYLASACEVSQKAENAIFDILEVIFLSFFKLRFFLDRLSGLELNHANCTLVCSLVHFDRAYERDILRKTLSESLDYNIDGLMSFRLRSLRDNWSELCDVAKRLVEGSGAEEDIYDIASFITGSDGNKCRLAVREDCLKNLTYRKNVEIVNLFDGEEYNLLSAIIKERPAEILIENRKLSAPMSKTLKHIARVIEK